MTLHALEVVHIAETGAVPRRSQTGPLGFRSFGSVRSIVGVPSFSHDLVTREQPFNAPRDTHDATFLAKSVAVCAGSSILILKPTECVLTVPPFSVPTSRPDGFAVPVSVCAHAPASRARQRRSCPTLRRRA